MMQEKYAPAEIEAKWQTIWAEQETFRLGKRPEAPKWYVLEMLPYPSGALHMGHVRNYMLGDVIARYQKMHGFEVVHPMGWDAFGLPAENAAIKDGVHPAKRTQENIGTIKAAMLALGYSYDWELEVNTSEPAYYRWNQWFFLKMREMGLVYRRFSRVNWCGESVDGSHPCFTVIANEQVADGCCERCDSRVVDREMPEWAFRITKYSQVLLDALDDLPDWPERIIAAQRNWIGRSDGAEIDFAVAGDEPIRVFTTRLDTIYGCTFVVVAPDSRAIRLATDAQRPAVRAFVAAAEAQSKAERTAEGAVKEGLFTGAYAVHPLSGARIPVWVANFVLSDYGTGAVMGVPAHDSRDFAFAAKFDLPIRRVVAPGDGSTEPEGAPYTEEGILMDSQEYSGKTSALARSEIAATLSARGQGKLAVTWRQKDWGFSRQRYWGTPIPIVYCDHCDPSREGISVPYEDLPIKLPEIETEKVLTGKGEPPLAKVPSWVDVKCPRCGGAAKREVETMDTFVDSSWYFARYLCPTHDKAPVDLAVTKRFLPVDLYIGGPEHGVMHLLYFRFWTRVMHELGLVNVDEPVRKLVTQGIVNGADGRKMSKRWGNAVPSTDLVNRVGADAARIYVLFAGPPERDFSWSDEQVEGALRFLRRVWNLARAFAPAEGAPVVDVDSPSARAQELRRTSHKTIKRVTEAIDRFSFNTAISAIMEMVNAVIAIKDPHQPGEVEQIQSSVRIVSQLLLPFAPHFANEIAQAYGATVPLEEQAWPTFDPSLVVDDVVPYAVQVMGKLRAEVLAPRTATEAEVRAIAEGDQKIQSALRGKVVKRLVFVPHRLVNFVV